MGIVTATITADGIDGLNPADCTRPFEPSRLHVSSALRL
jgi:hypothetical protein